MSDAATSAGGTIWTRAAVFALVLTAMAALMFVKWRTRFYTRMTTTHVQFTTAASKKSAGLFNSGRPLELTVSGFGRLEGQTGSVISNAGQENCTFTQAILDAIDMTSPVRVSLESADGALVMTLRREPSDESIPFLSLKSSQPALCIEDPGKDLAASDWNVFGQDKNSTLEVTLRPLSKDLPPEKDVPLEPGSDVTFWTKDNTSGILESKEGLRLSGLDRSIPLDEGQWLELKRLERAAFQSITFSEGDLVVALRGTAETILMEEGDVGATVAEVIGGNPELAKFLVFGAALAAVLEPLGKFIKRIW